MNKIVYKISDAITLLERGCSHTGKGNIVCFGCRDSIAQYLKALAERLTSINDIIRTELR